MLHAILFYGGMNRMQVEPDLLYPEKQFPFFFNFKEKLPG